MTHRPSTRCPSGLTLIEVVAALLVIGMLLTSLLLAKGRLTDQWSRANRQLEAVAVADRLLGEWWRQAEWPVDETGTLGDQRWTWRCTQQPTTDAAERLMVRIVRLELFTPGRDEPVVSVDVLVPTEPVETVDGEAYATNRASLAESPESEGNR